MSKSHVQISKSIIRNFAIEGSGEVFVDDFAKRFFGNRVPAIILNDHETSFFSSVKGYAVTKRKAEPKAVN